MKKSFLIGYKNVQMNMVSRAVMTEIVNFRLADSLIGIYLFRNVLGGYQRVSNSTIIGESSNRGMIFVLSFQGDAIFFRIKHSKVYFLAPTTVCAHK